MADELKLSTSMGRARVHLSKGQLTSAMQLLEHNFPEPSRSRRRGCQPSGTAPPRELVALRRILEELRSARSNMRCGMSAADVFRSHLDELVRSLRVNHDLVRQATNAIKSERQKCSEDMPWAQPRQIMQLTLVEEQADETEGKRGVKQKWQ
eukprot:6455448-Amphidinium_carterae.1